MGNNYTNTVTNGFNDYNQFNYLTSANTLVNQSYYPSTSASISTISPSTTFYGDVEFRGRVDFPEHKTEKIVMDEDDTILLTFDPEQYTVEQIGHIYEMWQRQFPNHKIILNYKGIKIDLIKDKSQKKVEEEVKW